MSYTNLKHAGKEQTNVLHQLVPEHVRKSVRILSPEQIQMSFELIPKREKHQPPARPPPKPPKKDKTDTTEKGKIDQEEDMTKGSSAAIDEEKPPSRPPPAPPTCAKRAKNVTSANTALPLHLQIKVQKVLAAKVDLDTGKVKYVAPLPPTPCQQTSSVDTKSKEVIDVKSPKLTSTVPPVPPRPPATYFSLEPQASDPGNSGDSISSADLPPSRAPPRCPVDDETSDTI